MGMQLSSSSCLLPALLWAPLPAPLPIPFPAPGAHLLLLQVQHLLGEGRLGALDLLQPLRESRMGSGMRTRTRAPTSRPAGSPSQAGSCPRGRGPVTPRGVLRVECQCLQMFQLFAPGSAGSWTHTCGHVPVAGCGGYPGEPLSIGGSGHAWCGSRPSTWRPERGGLPPGLCSWP